MEGATGWKVLWTIGGAIVAMLLLGVLTLQAISIVWLASSIDGLPTPRTMASVAVDELVEAGWLTQSRAATDRLLRGRSILLTNAVNEHTSRTIVEQLFLLNSEDSTQPIELFLSSPGGWGGSAFTVIDAIHRIEAPVNAHAVGLCYSSCALVLAASSGQRTATKNTIIMVHANLGNSKDPYSFARIAKARYEKLWREHSTLPKGWFPMTKDKAYYLTPREALRYGIIDEVVANDKKKP